MLLTKICTYLNNKLRTLTSRLRVLPDFIIVGAMKSGTSSLYLYTTQHPHILRASKIEVHYFDMNYYKGFKWYRSHFPTIFYKFIQRIIKKQKIITGESSPYYLFFPLSAQRIYKAFPNMKILILLRNPLDRAYSHYFHSTRWGFENLKFEEAIERESERLEGELHKILNAANYFGPNYGKFSYLARGKYLDQIKNYLNYFPRNQILIIKSEDFFKDTQKVMGKVFKFLGLPNWKVDTSRIFGKATYKKMENKTRLSIMNYFKPFNEGLYKFLGRNFNWEEENFNKLKKNNEVIFKNI